ncbi:MAG: porin [Gemmatimonadota bacterium]|nr:porin [Gemmatimonadota bacterium]
MLRTLNVVAWMVGIGTLTAGPVVAQDRDTTAVKRLEEQVEAITRELEDLRLGGDVVASADTSVYGFGPAASKVYKVDQGVSIGGYGEVLYQNFADSRQDETPSGATDRFDALRAIVYVGYKFSDKILFNSEIEFEHGSTEDGGSVSLEFGYLEYRLSPTLGLRGGLLLSPMGFINEIHEPPAFLGALRPETERQIIPSTWRENGIGVFGAGGAISYRAYLINGFDATGFGASGIRGGRQNGAEAAAENFGVVGRLDYTGKLGFVVGTSAYFGNSGQGAELPSAPGQTVGAQTFIWEGHAEYKARGFDLRGLVSVATLDDAAGINELNGLAGSASVGERLVGWYLQGGYDVLSGRGGEHQLTPYVRYEQVNTQSRIPAGFTPDPANDRRFITLGAAWKPLPNVSLKTDYQIMHNKADTGVNGLNVALGYLF